MLRRLLALVVAVVGLAFGVAPVASADAPVCPTAPDALSAAEVEDDPSGSVVLELRALRREQVAVCEREDERARALRDRVGDVVAAVEDQRGTEDRPVAVTSVDEAEPVEGTVALSADDRDLLATGFNVGDSTRWYAIGGALALLLLAGLFWASRPDR
jgi:hypothetical protein